MTEHVRVLSVSNGHDSSILDTLVALHAPTVPRIIDVTHNSGKMWKGSKHQPLRLDLDGSMPIDIAGSFRAIPLKDGCADVVVFDPPHMLDGSSAKYGMYGTTGRNTKTIAHDYLPFLTEASRVLVPGGIVLAKLADQIHDHAYRWEQVSFINAIQSAGLTACDMIVKVGSGIGTMIDPKWVTVFHTRRAHSYWIVARNSVRCERMTGATAQSGRHG